MSAKTLDRPTAGDPVAQVIGGRTYDGGRHYEDIAALQKMPIPEGMQALGTAVRDGSSLLALKPSQALRAEEVHRAYGRDFELMLGWRTDFKRLVEAAVAARADAAHIDAQQFLAQMVNTIGGISHEPLLDLSAETMSLAPVDQLAKLQEQFRTDVDELLVNVAVWFHSLVERDIVSAIEWLAGRAGVRYTFYRVTSTRDEATKTHDPGMHLVGRYETTTKKTTVDVRIERHVHTVGDAAVYTPEEYPDHVPDRIARLIDSTPARLRPFVTVIGGKVAKEEVTTSHQGRVIHDVERHWKPDPAYAIFGTWALGGWGGSIQEPARATYSGHKSRKALVVFGVGIALTAVCAMGAALENPRIGGIIAIGGLIVTAIAAASQFIGSNAAPTRR